MCSLQPFGYGALAGFLAGDDAAGAGAVNDVEALKELPRDAEGAEGLLILIGSELRGGDLKKLVEFGLTCSGCEVCAAVGLRQLARRGGYGPAAGYAAGLYAARRRSASRSMATSATPGLDMLEMFDAAAAGKLSALYVVGANPVLRYGVDAAALKDTFVVVQEMFMTETAVLADVVLPAANLYEKSGSVTNHYGDLQQVNKAGDRAGVRSDFEMIVRVADKMGAHIPTLIPFGKGLRSGYGTDARRAVGRGGPPCDLG